jgi:integral membrane sensor domain MASE1
VQERGQLSAEQTLVTFLARLATRFERLVLIGRPDKVAPRWVQVGVMAAHVAHNVLRRWSVPISRAHGAHP